ncbi:MAG: DedA family protein [Pseudomonadota bacterium]
MTEWVFRIVAAGGYWGIAFLMCLENVVPPIPSELIMGLGGIAVARGDMALAPLLIAATFGTVLGNVFWYEIGRRMGVARLRPIVDRWGRWLTLDWREIERLEGYFERRGGAVVFVFRMLPTFRTMISLPAGLLAMPRWKFLLWTAAGSAIWNTVLAGAGMYLGQRFADLDRVVGPAAVVLIAAFVAWYFWRVLTWKPAEQ